MENLTWHPRQVPLKPSGILALSEHRVLMSRALNEMCPDRFARLRGSYSEQVLLILGNDDDLPWVPNGIYLGQESSAPHLYLPTQLSPNLPTDWLARAVLRQFGEGQFAINPWQKQVYNLSQALKVDLKRLQALF